MQLVVSGNRILAHGEGFLAMGGTVINPDTGKAYQNATVVECDGCPSDIDKVGYEYHAGQFVPCAPFGVGDGNLAVVCNEDCKSIKDSGMLLKDIPLMPGILSANTKSLYGLPADAMPDAAFMALKIPAGYHGLMVTVKFSDGTLAANLELKGLHDFMLGTAVTDENGFCYALTTSLNPVVDFTNYVGIVGKTVELTVDENMVYTPVEIIVDKDTAPRLIETSGDVRCYEGGLLDVCAVGAGGGGGGDNRSGRAGGGGGGGYVTNVLGLPSVKRITVSIGAGGSPASVYSAGAVSGAGGLTTVTIAGKVVASANGGGGGQNSSSSGHGAGGVGNGNGGSKSAGGDGTVRVFDDPELPLPSGGGASGDFAGGADFGGSGGYQKTGTSGTGPGGGGAGSDGYNADKTIVGAAGHAGGVYVRVRFK